MKKRGVVVMNTMAPLFRFYCFYSSGSSLFKISST